MHTLNNRKPKSLIAPFRRDDNLPSLAEGLGGFLTCGETVSGHLISVFLVPLYHIHRCTPNDA